MMASVLATFAQFERRLIGQRTRDALAVKRAQGVQLGPPREISEEVVERIRNLYETGHSVAARTQTERGERPPSPGRALAHPRRQAGALLGSRVKNDSNSESTPDGPTVLAPASGDRAAC